jgi:predicted transglutaminase-like cysteine proteinase
MKALFVTAALVATGGIASGAHASSWLKTGGPTSIPVGHYEYCKAHRSDCRAHGGSTRPPSGRMSVLRSVNLKVNRSITEISDRKQHGKREVWSFPAKAGDCEDYVLAKRAALMRRGFKPGDLRAVRDRFRRMGARHRPDEEAGEIALSYAQRAAVRARWFPVSKAGRPAAARR